VLQGLELLVTVLLARNRQPPPTVAAGVPHDELAAELITLPSGLLAMVCEAIVKLKVRRGAACACVCLGCVGHRRGADEVPAYARLSPSGAGEPARRYHTIRYVKKCKDAQGAHEDPYEEPGSPICSESVESAQKCAFGLGDTCKRCPYGAICPGGDEARSFPGFYTTSSARGAVEPCTAPATERCTGWDAQTLTTRCGEAYAGEHQLAFCENARWPSWPSGSL
jgi:hypothetical protein